MIRDADFSLEVIESTTAQILTQSTTALFVRTSILPQNELTLFR